MSEGSPRVPPKYGSPPINEVVFGVWFPLIDQMRAVHWGMLWERYRSEYPESEQMPRLGPLSSGPSIAIPFDSPRVWFAHPNGNRLVQVQADAFFSNWRKKRNEDPYPGYGATAAEFSRQYSVFQAFVSEMGWGEIAPVAYDLSYIDIMPLDESRDALLEFGYFLPDFRWRDGRPSYLSKPLGVNWQTHFAMPDDSGLIKLAIASARLSSDQTSVIRMELNARGMREKLKTDDMMAWFNEAHDALIDAFTFLTSEEAQRDRWRLQS